MSLCVYMYIYVHTYTNTCTFTYTDVHKCAHAQTHVYIYATYMEKYTLLYYIDSSYAHYSAFAVFHLRIG